MNNYRTMIMDYMTWLESAKIVSDLGEELKEETLKGVPGLLFGDMSHIEIRMEMRSNPGVAKLETSFGCITGREEIETQSLLEAVDFLWNTHSSMEWSRG
jgi:hypothetical protein